MGRGLAFGHPCGTAIEVGLITFDFIVSNGTNVPIDEPGIGFTGIVGNPFGYQLAGAIAPVVT